MKESQKTIRSLKHK